MPRPLSSMLRGLICFAALGACDTGAEPLEATAYFEDAGPYPQFGEIAFYEEWGRAYAEAIRRCCESAGLTYSKEARAPYVSPPDRSSGAKFNPAAGGACVEQTRNQSCDLGKGPLHRLDACGKIYDRGRRKTGEACSSTWDCAPPAEPDSYATCGGSDDSQTKGVCGKQRTRKIGESCGANPPGHDSCDVGLLCDEASQLCVAPPGLGEACITGSSWGDTCAAGAVCDRLNTKTCVVPKPIGTACGAPEECEYLACIGGLCREPLFYVTICETP